MTGWAYGEAAVTAFEVVCGWYVSSMPSLKTSQLPPVRLSSAFSLSRKLPWYLKPDELSLPWPPERPAHPNTRPELWLGDCVPTLWDPRGGHVDRNDAPLIARTHFWSTNFNGILQTNHRFSTTSHWLSQFITEVPRYHEMTSTNDHWWAAKNISLSCPC